MSRRPKPAPTAGEVKLDAMNDLREVLLGIACQIVVTSGDENVAESYLGIDLENFSLGSMPSSYREDIDAIDLDRFFVAKQVNAACDFALQLGTLEARNSFTEDDWNDLSIFLDGAPRCSFGGEQTPLAHEDSVLRRTLEMAVARMSLRHGGSLTIRQLALLAGIGETAVRTSLSADGIKTEGKPAQLRAEVAEPWLRRRRGFVPTLEMDDATSNDGTVLDLSDDTAPFEKLLEKLASNQGQDLNTLAANAQVEVGWLSKLFSGASTECDVSALCRVAKVLGVDPPSFAGRAVEAILLRT